MLKPVLGKYSIGVSSGVSIAVLRIDARINSGHNTQLCHSNLPTFLSVGIFSLALRHSVIVKRIYFNVCKPISTGVIGL